MFMDIGPLLDQVFAGFEMGMNRKFVWHHWYDVDCNFPLSFLRIFVKMDVATLRDELDKAIRDNNLGIEEYELEHQEQKRLLEKWMREAERWLRGKKSFNAADLMKRPLSSVLADESKHVPLRSSRSAAKAAATKIRSAVEAESEGNSKKRRCIVKIERISAPQSVLDIIVEEQETNNISPNVADTLVKLEVASATVNDKPHLDCQKTVSKDNNGDSPSSDHQSPFQRGVVANSTFVLDVVQPETVKCLLPEVSDKPNRDCENSPTETVQNKSGTELHSTFVISTGNADAISDKLEEYKQLNALTKTPEKQMVNLNDNKTKKSGSKVPVGNGVTENEAAYSNLQKLIIESPVRVTRTKTRAFAQAVAAAAATTNSRENGQVSAISNCLMSPTFQKNSNKTTEDNMKENILAEKAMKESAIKDLNSAPRLKTPLSANNTLSSNSFQSSKMGMGTVVSHCETFITKNVTKPALNHMNQKLIEENKYVEEKVTEAEKKKERMLKEKAEQQRRNNEARAAKVAKTREQLERQRLIQQQQLEREKEQRLKIAQQKREEEIALKRQLAHQRAAEAEERRKQDEEQYVQALKKKEQEEAEKKALQLKKEAEEQLKIKEAEKNKKEIKVKPNAPDKVAKLKPNGVFSTNDIYSGEESEDEEVTVKKVYPSWTSANRARGLQLSSQEQCRQLIAQFFQFKPHTPDLIKIFGTVPEKTLVRTSSAVWHTPPCNKTFN
ncbi:calponin homology domain-containing protein DDB_G0272472 isoform X3 [Schistocerca serialis cubense]|uniref:calponin homology domain-containing protein DDB_G0272472 isoform X3 n=1 Tax=Schistocerca serialis cubense TaxID=2023355 RepID=UPI00214EE236|nr:calponin homology domain-containing protein DDB_G0272472 isoform X3 [Schistocerca serialis cubense]